MLTRFGSTISTAHHSHKLLIRRFSTLTLTLFLTLTVTLIVRCRNSGLIPVVQSSGKCQHFEENHANDPLQISLIHY